MRFTVESPLTPTDAFARIGDFGSLAEWDPFVHTSELVVGERLSVGAVYELAAPGGIRLRYELIDIRAPVRVVYAGGSKRARSTDTITVASSGGGSVVVIESSLEFAGWLRAAGALLRLLVWVGGRYVSLPAMQRHLAHQPSGAQEGPVGH